ncbi:MAG: type II secretion system F family protein [Microbacteriaceae bacterium]|nr:type II secretion system F family protein [Microbacteriaceae bacterium]
MRAVGHALQRVAGTRAAGVPLLLFSQELLALLEGGLTIVEAIDVLTEKESRPAIRGMLETIGRGLGEGKSFSSCIEEMPSTFPPLYVGIVRSAEKTSSLAVALSRYVDYQSRVDAVRTKIVSAAIYPVILLLVGAGVIGFLGVYVVPRFAAVYRGTGRSLPLMSEWLLAWGTWISGHTLSFAAIVACAFVLGSIGLRMGIARGSASVLFAQLPVLSEKLRIYGLTRLYLTLGMLLEGGLPAVEALRLARGTLTSELCTRLDAARVEITNGERMSDAFEHTGLTTVVSARFMRVGEHSGRLGEMLNRSARYYDGEIARWIERFTRTFEPLLMVAIGVVVGLIVVLLYMPIFDLAGSMQ